VGAQTGGDSEIGVAPIVTPLGGVLLIAEAEAKANRRAFTQRRSPI